MAHFIIDRESEGRGEEDESPINGAQGSPISIRSLMDGHGDTRIGLLLPLPNTASAEGVD